MTERVHPAEADMHADDIAQAADAAEAQPVPPAPPRKAEQPAGAGQDMPREMPRRPVQPQPSWVMSATGEQLTREELLARYRQQRALPDDPFAPAVRRTAADAPRPRPRPGPQPARRLLERPEDPPADAPPAPTPRGGLSLGQTFGIAAAMALLAGGGAGVLSAYLAAPHASAPAQALATPPAAETAPEGQQQQLQLAEAGAARTTVIERKPVSTATLQVADVAGETNSFIPLALHAAPAGLEQDILLKISGVPEGAYLTSGHRQEDQVWALSLSEIKGVKLVVPEADGPQIDLAVAAFEPRTGELAAPVKTMTVALKDVVVKPTSAPPEQDSGPAAMAARTSALPGADPASELPAPIPPPDSIKVALGGPDLPGTQQLLTEADSLFKNGDVRAARQAYEQAWGSDGSAAAAYGLARSFDPVVLSALALKNAGPDKAQAIQWYQRAASAGNPEAAEAIVRLRMKP